MFDIPRVQTSLRIDHYSLILCPRVLQRVQKFSQWCKDVLSACLWFLKHLFVDFSVSPILSNFRFLPRTTVRLAEVRRKWPGGLCIDGEIGSKVKIVDGEIWSKVKVVDGEIGSKVQVGVIGEYLGSQQGQQKQCIYRHHVVCECRSENKRTL